MHRDSDVMLLSVVTVRDFSVLWLSIVNCHVTLIRNPTWPIHTLVCRCRCNRSQAIAEVLHCTETPMDCFGVWLLYVIFLFFG